VDECPNDWVDGEDYVTNNDPDDKVNHNASRLCFSSLLGVYWLKRTREANDLLLASQFSTPSASFDRFFPRRIGLLSTLLLFLSSP